ncbi:MAG: glycerophosphodiester phosphodiesterase family protein, partial [Bacteroidota bacterium]
MKTEPVPNAEGKNIPVQLDKQGHRGCRGLMPENTVPAMNIALNIGVSTVELDVVITIVKSEIFSQEPWVGH